MVQQFRIPKKKFISQKDVAVVEDLQEALNRVSRKGNLLLSLMYEIEKVKTKEHLFRFVIGRCLEIFKLDSASIYLINEEKSILQEVYTKNVTPKIDEKLNKIKLIHQIPLSTDYPMNKAFNQGKTLMEDKKIPSIFKKAGIESAIFSPIILNETVSGILCLRAGKNSIFEEEDTRLAQLIALQVSQKIDNLDLVNNLKSQKQRLEIVQNTIKEGLSLHGPDGVIYYANPVVGQFFGTVKSTVGVKRETLIKSWEEYHKYEIERLYDLEQMKKTVYENKKPFTGLMKIHSNPIRFVEANYFPVQKNGNFAGMAASYRDITKERKQEDELEKRLSGIKTEKDRWEAIFENVDEGICLLDSNLRITHMNASCELSSGISLEKARGMQFHQVFKCHTKDGLYYPDFQPLNRVVLTKEVLAYDEHLHTNANGNDYWVGVSASPLLDTKGELEEVILVIRDISKMKEVEKAKSDFVSIASHELRTPLTVINGYLTLLLGGDLGDFTDETSRERLRITLKKVSNETQRLTHLVSDLLNVTRIEEKRIQINPVQTSVAEVITEVVEDVKNLAFEKKITLQVDDKGSNGLTAYFDKTKIYQVLLNLVDNSIKFTPEGGRVTVSYWTEGNKAYISVEDTGIGIPNKLINNIFEKFQQVPGSYLKENRGTGLGLFIAKSLVEMHRGSLKVESEIGRGSKFTFSLPNVVA